MAHQNHSEQEEPCSKKQRGQGPHPPTSWRWSPEAQAYYEALAQEQIDEMVRQGKPLPRGSWQWEFGSSSAGPSTGGDDAQRIREATVELAARLRSRDRTRWLQDIRTPADFSALYHRSEPATTGPGPRSAINFGVPKWHNHFSPRLAYRTWNQLCIKEDDLKEFGYSRMLPKCVRDLVDEEGAFFWQLIDCFTSLRIKLNEGRGVHVANTGETASKLSCLHNVFVSARKCRCKLMRGVPTGEFFALYLAVHNMNDGNEQDELLEDDDAFVALPEWPHDQAGRSCDEYLRIFLANSGPLGNKSPARRVCAPFALCEPSFMEDWAPVPEDVRRLQADAEAEALQQSSGLDALLRTDSDGNGMPTGAAMAASRVGESVAWQQMVDRIKQQFREQVKVPEQTAAQAASYTAPAEWFKDYPRLDPLTGNNSASQSPDSDQRAFDVEEEDDTPFEFSGGALYSHLPDISLNRADGATIRIGISPFDEGSRWGDSAPVMGQSFNSAEIVGFIMLPGMTRPVGRIHANAVERDAHSWGSHSDFFWACDAISEEFVNAVLTFLVSGDQICHLTSAHKHHLTPYTYSS